MIDTIVTLISSCVGAVISDNLLGKTNENRVMFHPHQRDYNCFAWFNQGRSP